MSVKGRWILVRRLVKDIYCEICGRHTVCLNPPFQHQPHSHLLLLTICWLIDQKTFTSTVRVEQTSFSPMTIVLSFLALSWSCNILHGLFNLPKMFVSALLLVACDPGAALYHNSATSGQGLLVHSSWNDYIDKNVDWKSDTAYSKLRCNISCEEYFYCI